MKYYSLHHKSPISTFKNAVVQGLAKDRGIYFPNNITKLSNQFIENISDYTNHEIAYEVIKQFVGDEIPAEKLKEIIEKLFLLIFLWLKLMTTSLLLSCFMDQQWLLKMLAQNLWHNV